MFTPAPSALRASAVSRNGIIGFSYVVSDDGLLALVEFVARDRSAFQPILAFISALDEGFNGGGRQKTLKVWVPRKRGTKKLVCSGCGRHWGVIHETTEREVRDLPWSEYRATVIVELHRVRCPDCGLKIERVAQLPSKAPLV